jgi:hypothetical protein
MHMGAGMVVCAYNPRYLRLRQKHQSKASLGKNMKLYLKNKLNQSAEERGISGRGPEF